MSANGTWTSWVQVELTSVWKLLWKTGLLNFWPWLNRVLSAEINSLLISSLTLIFKLSLAVCSCTVEMHWRLTVSLGLFSTVSHGLMGSWTAATCWCCQVKWWNTLTSSSGFFMPSHCPSAQSDRPAAGTVACLITCWPEQNPPKNILWKATWEQNLPDCLAHQRNC